MRPAAVVLSPLAVLAVLPALAAAGVRADEPSGAFPTRAWTAHQQWYLHVESFPRGGAGGPAQPASYRMSVLISGTQRFADSLCFQVDFIPHGAPPDMRNGFSLLVGKRGGWPMKKIGAPPSAPSPFRVFPDASMLTAAPDGFPAELFPLKPFEAAAPPASLRVTRREQLDGLVVEAEVRTGEHTDLLVRQRWVEGEPWWREYERYVGGELDLRAERLPPAEVKPAPAKPTEPPPAPPPPAEPEWLAMLRDDPRLQTPVALNLKHCPLQDLLDRLSDKTSLQMQMSVELGAQKPLLGGFSGEAPAWQVMRLAALQNVVAGRWEKTDGGYRLSGERPVSVAPTHEPPKGGCNYWLVIPSWILIAALCVWALIYQWRHRHEAPKA